MSITLHNLSPLDEMDWAGPRGHLTAAHTTGHHASVDRSLSGRADGVTPLVFVCTPGLHITCPATVATSRTVPSPLWTDQPFTPTDQIVFCRPFLEPSACTYGCVRKKKTTHNSSLLYAGRVRRACFSPVVFTLTCRRLQVTGVYRARL